MNLKIEPSLDRLRELSGKYKCLPVYASCYADTETPISIFQRFEETSENCFLLESVEGGEKWARYSFLAKDPLAVIRSKGGETTATLRDGTVEILEGKPIEAVKSFMSRFRGPEFPELPRLYGGAVGYAGYDIVRYQEELPNPPRDDLNLDELCFLVADEIMAFDHVRQKLVFIITIPAGQDIEAAYHNASDRIQKLYKLINSPKARDIGFHNGSSINCKDTPGKEAKGCSDFYEEGQIFSSMTKEEYMDAVKQAKKHIVDGDIFQIVLSQRFSTKASASPLNVYRLLRVTNPSPYMFYIKLKDTILAGASPEMLFRCENGIVETCPIAGTRPRGITQEEDIALERELLSDEKEKSEHVMLVDLGRNDLGRVCEFSSVQVYKFMEVVRFSKVMHISSTVTGKLKDGLSPLDALMSVFPAGTLSGAPKVRAMELIDTFEPTRRGPYGGAIGYMSFDGNFDSCITIRTILFKGDTAYVQVGAGIVADSDPEREYEECRNKAFAMLSALREAGAGL